MDISGCSSCTDPSPFTRSTNQRQSVLVQNRIKLLTKENDTLKKQLREVLRERDRQLREVAAEEAQKYEHKLEQIRRRLSDQRTKEIQVLKQSMSKEWNRRVNLVEQNKDKEVARIQSHLSMRESLKDALTRTRQELSALKARIQAKDSQISDLELALEDGKISLQTYQHNLESVRMEHTKELRTMKAAFEDQMNKLEVDLKAKKAQILSLESSLSSQQLQLQHMQWAEGASKQNLPVQTTKQFKPCQDCKELRSSLRLSESEKKDAMFRTRQMESALLKAGQGMETNSIVMALLGRVQQMEGELDRLQAKLSETNDQKELLEFQLLEMQEEAESSAAPEAIPRSLDIWHHPFTVLSPTPNDESWMSHSSEDEGFLSRDESCSSDSAVDGSPIPQRAIRRRLSIPISKMSDDLRIKFSLLRHRRTLRHEDRQVVAEVKKRWDALEAEHSKCMKLDNIIHEEEAVKPTLNTRATQADEFNGHEFELRQELAKLKYMIHASEETEKRQKQCIKSLKQQLEALREGREAEMDILKKTVTQYSNELEQFRKGRQSGFFIDAGPSNRCDTGSSTKDALTKTDKGSYV